MLTVRAGRLALRLLLVPPRQDRGDVVDPTALVRSLGPPQLPGQKTYAEHYLAAVVERAAAIAGAVAAAAGVGAEPDDD